MFKWIQRSNICSEQKSWSDFYFSAALTFQESFSKQNFYACAWAKRSDIVATFHLHSSSVKSPLKNKLFVFLCSVFFWLFCFKIRCDLQIHFIKAILHLTECEWNVAATLLFFCFCTCLKDLFTDTFLNCQFHWKVEIISTFLLRTNATFFLNKLFLSIHLNKVSHYNMAYSLSIT